MWIAKFWYRTNFSMVMYYEIELDPGTHIFVQKMDPEKLIAKDGKLFDKFCIDGEVDYIWEREDPTPANLLG